MAKVHEAAHIEFSATFPPNVIAKWEAMVHHWECDENAPNPFEEPATSKCQMLLSID